MARVKLSPSEVEARKLKRRADKKAKKELVKESAVVITKSETTKGKTSALVLIEIPETDSESRKRLASLREEGVQITYIGYATEVFLYRVPSNIAADYTKHASTKVKADTSEPAELNLSTYSELEAKVKADVASGAKLNKRYIKLLVRNSGMKRNLKKESTSKLLKQFKVK